MSPAQSDRGQPLALDGDVVQVAVGAMVDREVQAQLGLPTVQRPRRTPCPKSRRRAGGSGGAHRCWPGCRSPWSPDEDPRSSGQAGPLGTAQRFQGRFPRVRLDKQPDRGDLGDVLGAHLHDERPAEGIFRSGPPPRACQCLAEGRSTDPEVFRDVSLANCPPGGTVRSRMAARSTRKTPTGVVVRSSAPSLRLIAPPLLVFCRPYRSPRAWRSALKDAAGPGGPAGRRCR